jgi:hypothetical protein
MMSRHFSRFFLKTALVTACLTGVLVVAGAPGAEARVKGPRLDSLSAGCGAAQDEADKLVAETGTATEARKTEIFARLREIADFWDRYCRDTFGSINPLRFPASVSAPRKVLDGNNVALPSHTDPKPKPRDPKALVPRPPAQVLEAEASDDESEELRPSPTTPPAAEKLDPTDATSKRVSR